MNEQQVREYLGGLADTVEIGPPPVAEVLESRPGPAARWLVVGGAIALAAAATIVAVVLTRGGDQAPRPEPATQVPSQSGAGAWWTPGSIHFGTGTLPFDDVDDPTDDVGWMVPAPDGVIVATLNGRIALVETSGRVTALGSYPPGTGGGWGPMFLVDRTDGRIAWTDSDRLFVYDPGSRAVIAERPDSSGSFPQSVLLHGFDEGKVYWDVRSLGNRIWDWAADTTRHVGGGGSYIHGVRAGTWLVEHRANAGAYGVLADEAEGEHSIGLPKDLRLSTPGFSPDGALVALTSDDGDRIVVFRSADPARRPGIPLTLPAGYAAAAAWQDDQTLLLVMRSPDSVARQLVTCVAATGACRTDERVDGPVVIAGEGVWEMPPQ